MINKDQILEDGEITPEFNSIEERELFGIAQLGVEATTFFQSDVGRAIIGAAAQDIDELKDELANVSPWRKRKIQKVQNAIKARRQAIAYIAEIINLGEEAHQALIEMRQ
jgi:hypothetical protein